MHQIAPTRTRRSIRHVPTRHDRIIGITRDMASNDTRRRLQAKAGKAIPRGWSWRASRRGKRGARRQTAATMPHRSCLKTTKTSLSRRGCNSGGCRLGSSGRGLRRQLPIAVPHLQNASQSRLPDSIKLCRLLHEGDSLETTPRPYFHATVTGVSHIRKISRSMSDASKPCARSVHQGTWPGHQMSHCIL
jgi:hypothetical protein